MLAKNNKEENEMNENVSKKITLSIIAIIVAILGGLGFYFENEDKTQQEIIDAGINTLINEYQKINQVVVSGDAILEADETKKATEDGEEVATTEEITSDEEQEQEVTDEGAIEQDATVEQENISYNGTNTGNGLSLLGSYQGLTYYNQADSRWANILYTSTGNTSQTIASSGCGPTSAAMVVSSSKGAILPTTMASLFVSNGYRTANNGTAWSAFSFVADYFDFNEYTTTSNFNTAMNYLKTDKDGDGNSDYYIIVSCGSGLFTTGGHYIVLVADNNGTITVYDPYLYAGKFNTASRRAAGVVVSGNSAYVSESSFKTYGNAQNYWIFSNDEGEGNPNKNSSSTTTSYTRYVSTASLPLNVRNSENGAIIGSIKKGTAVTVVSEANGWSRITSPISGYVSTSYLSSVPVSTSSSTVTTSTVGQTRKIKACNLYSNSNLTGTVYNYKANTTVTILQNVSSNIDKVKVNATGRIAYISTSNYTTSSTSSTSSTTKSTVGQYKRFKGTTYIYSNSNLTGTKYTYLAQTQVKIIKNISSNVDYVYVVRTGRYGYVNTSSYK